MTYVKNEKSCIVTMLQNMHILYPDYRFEMLPIVIGALGFVPLGLFNFTTNLGYEKKEALKHISKMQAIVSSGTVKICKTFLNF